MPGRVLFDTNAVISLFKEDPDLLRLLTASEETYLNSVVLGELFFGAQKSRRRQENLLKIEALAAASRVLGCDLNTARRYGELREELRARGRPIPENDLWIAASAVQHGLSLVSRDRHFVEIAGLRTLAW